MVIHGTLICFYTNIFYLIIIHSMTSSTPLVTVSTFAALLGIILMAGAIRWAILLRKDAKKHKKFAKVIRMISAIVQLLAIFGSVVITLVIFSNTQSVGARFGRVMTFLLCISILSIVTSIRWAILLFVQSGRVKWFAKWIRIICGILMIIALFSSFVTGV